MLRVEWEKPDRQGDETGTGVFQASPVEGSFSLIPQENFGGEVMSQRVCTEGKSLALRLSNCQLLLRWERRGGAQALALVTVWLGPCANSRALRAAPEHGRRCWV